MHLFIYFAAKGEDLVHQEYSHSSFFPVLSVCSASPPSLPPSLPPFRVTLEPGTTDHEEVGPLQHRPATVLLLLQRREGVFELTHPRDVSGGHGAPRPAAGMTHGCDS